MREVVFALCLALPILVAIVLFLPREQPKAQVDVACADGSKWRGVYANAVGWAIYELSDKDGFAAWVPVAYCSLLRPGTLK